MSVPMIIIICLFLACIEINLILASNFGNDEVAFQAIIIQFIYLITKTAEGFSETAIAIYGNLIGARSVPLAQRFMNLIRPIVFSFFAVCSLTYYTLRKPFSTVLTEYEEVQ